jgi:glycosyltransferase A (GT-A) superfamily protein (DUF2064 family)
VSEASTGQPPTDCAGVSGPTGDIVLVVAKSPVPGVAKTRLAETIGPGAAADLAAAALLDTLDAAGASGARVVVAVTGDLVQAARQDEVRTALRRVTVLEQRGDGLAERLANAHADAHALAARDSTGRPAVFQVGMDTPQLTPGKLVDALAAARSHDAVLGPATDGGWWGLAVARPALADVLTRVAMSTPSTGRLTRAALEATGVEVGSLSPLRDVDEWPDAVAVAAQAPAGRFAAAVGAVGPVLRSCGRSGG